MPSHLISQRLFTATNLPDPAKTAFFAVQKQLPNLIADFIFKKNPSPALITSYLSLGSNLGDRISNLHHAIAELQTNSIQITKISSIYETEPVGVKNQPWFLNLALQAETSLSAPDLLNLCKKIEKKLGRTPRTRWQEREIDIDIIYYNQKIFNFKNLQLPHSERSNRNFVLIPLNEIAPNFRDPELKVTISQLLSRCPDTSIVKKIAK